MLRPNSVDAYEVWLRWYGGTWNLEDIAGCCWATWFCEAITVAILLNPSDTDWPIEVIDSDGVFIAFVCWWSLSQIFFIIYSCNTSYFCAMFIICWSLVMTTFCRLWILRNKLITKWTTITWSCGCLLQIFHHNLFPSHCGANSTKLLPWLETQQSHVFVVMRAFHKQQLIRKSTIQFGILVLTIVPVYSIVGFFSLLFLNNRNKYLSFGINSYEIPCITSFTFIRINTFGCERDYSFLRLLHLYMWQISTAHVKQIQHGVYNFTRVVNPWPSEYW